MFGFNGFMWAQPIAEILNTVIAALLGLSLARTMPGRHKSFVPQRQSASPDAE
jgi:hypothetical protein